MKQEVPTHVELPRSTNFHLEAGERNMDLRVGAEVTPKPAAKQFGTAQLPQLEGPTQLRKLCFPQG